VRRRSRRLFILLIDTHAFMRTGMYLARSLQLLFGYCSGARGEGENKNKLIPRGKTLLGSSFLMVLCIPKKTLPLPVCTTERGGGWLLKGTQA
jgi:hypothetical protein